MITYYSSIAEHDQGAGTLSANSSKEDECDDSGSEIQEHSDKESISLKRIESAVIKNQTETEIQIEGSFSAITKASNQLSASDELINKQDQPEWSLRYEAPTNEGEDEIHPVSTRDIINWAFQIARGMDYLSSKKVFIS